MNTEAGVADCKRLMKANYSVKQSSEIDFATINEPFPLTEVQMAYLMGRDPKFELGGVSCHYYIEIESKLDLKKLNWALREVINRHPMLRTVVLADGRQCVLKEIPDYQIVVVDLSHLDCALRQEGILNERERMSHYVFQAERWPLFEIKAFQLAEGRYYIFAGFDLLIADATSLHIITQELMTLYQNPNYIFPELSYTFKDFVREYRRQKASEKYQADKKFWLDQLDKFPPAPALPLKQEPASIIKPHFNRCCKQIGKNDWERLKSKCRQYDIRPTVVFCTAYAMALAFWSNQPDLAINLTVSNRYPVHEDIDRIVGDFTSLMLIAVYNLNDALSFWDRARMVQNTLNEALKHKSYDGVEFIRELAKTNNYGNKAIMPVVLTSLMFGNLQEDWAQFGEVQFNITQTAQLYLDNQIWKSDQGITLIWDYVEQLFDREIIAGIFEQYVMILDNVINSDREPGVVIGAADRALIAGYNAAQTAIRPQTLHAGFVEQARKFPDRPAVLSQEQNITYQQLDKLSNQVANYLVEQGIGKGDFVGALVYRCVASIVNIFGILKAGAAYVPVNPEHPEERRNYILEDSGCKMMLEPEFYHRCNLAEYNSDMVKVTVTPEEIAYVIYTSGSTGKPKGVVISHEAAANTVIDINRKFRVSAADRIAGISSMCFDLSVYDIFGALAAGAALVLVPDQRDVTNLIELLDTQRITVWNSVPAIMDMVTDNIGSDYTNCDLRLVMLSGDWIPLNLPGKIRFHFKNSEVISLGGATEASIWSIYYPITELRPEWRSIPYGWPLANQQFYVLNYNRELCPVGVQGELWIGGVGLAKGYLNDAEKTRQAFVMHPEFGQLYRTGDYGVMRREGYIEFLGRKDQQVKIRGHRIELGEIEAALRDFPGVRDAVVLVAERHNTKQLVGYVVADQAGPQAEQAPGANGRVVAGRDWERLVAGGTARARQIPETITVEGYQNFDGQMEQLAIAYICNTLRRMGVFINAGETWNLDQLISHCGIRPQYRKLMAQWLSVLEEEGWISQTDQYGYESIRSLPESPIDPLLQGIRALAIDEGWKNPLRYVEPFAGRIISILKGELNPLTLLFADGDWELAESVYQYNPMAVYFNEIAAEALRNTVNGWPPDKKIRILEFGAGTGGTTAALLAVLPPERTIYTYSDLSTFFTDQAKEKFRNYPFVNYSVFDIDKNPFDQGFSPHSYDIVFGANVLHDARILNTTLGHFKSLLAPDGLLMILEITKNKRYHKISIGFIEGFSNYADEREKVNLPLHTVAGWQKVFQDNGFDKFAAFPGPELPTQVFNQHIMVARGPAAIKWVRPEEVKDFLVKKLPEYMAPAYIINLERLPLTANGKIDRKALPEPDERAEVYEQYIAPGSRSEKILAAIWETTLGTDKIGRNHNFFACGGDSLKAIQITAKARKSGINISIMDIYNNPDIGKLAAFIENQTAPSTGTNHAVPGASVVSSKEPAETLGGEMPLVPAGALFDPFPLTDIQLAYLVGRSPHLELGGVSTHYYMEIETGLDIPKLSRSLQKVIQRHPMLRAIVLPDGKQKILESVPDYWIQETDLSQLAETEQDTYLTRERDRMSHQIFKTDQWPLFEFKAFKLKDRVTRLLIGIDILITDGSSMYIIGRELKDFYDYPEQELPELKFNFREYMAAYQNFKQSAFYQGEKRYWLDKLADFPPAPALPLQKDPLQVTIPHRFKRCSRVIGRRDWERLKRRAVARNLTPAALICTAYVEVLAFWCNQSRLAIDLTVFNRYQFHKEVGQIVGDFTSIVLLDIDLTSGDFWEHAKIVQQALSAALEHRHYDGVEFIREISKYHNMGTRAVMPVIFTCVLFNDTRDGWTEIGEIRDAISQTPQVYLDNQVLDMNGELRISWDYVMELFDKTTITTMFNQYIGILENLIEAAPVSKLKPPFQDQELVSEYNRTEARIVPTTLCELFKQQALLTPDKTAVELNTAGLTYSELDRTSNRVAYYLQQRGIVRGDKVGILAAREPGTIVNVMGVLKAGAVYVPVNPEHPAERRNYILADSGCGLLLEPGLAFQGNLNEPAVGEPMAPVPGDIAYIIYTSGSTGRPKGVVITHGAAVNTIIDINRKFAVNSTDRIIGVSSMCFDLSVYDIFGALSSGATLVMAPDQRDIANLCQILSQQQITVWNSVPAIMDLVAANLETESANNSLRLVMLSGDWIPLKLPAKIRRCFPKTQLISLGGATEASIWSIYYPVTEIRPEWRSVPYGNPLANQRFYVLNYAQELCPVGVSGELYIGGVGVAAGYQNDPEKTSSSFIHHPSFGRIYRTGDYGVLHKEGYIEFLGRKDHQIKIRGHRIELGEIEGALLKHSLIKNAVVIDFNDPDGNKALCAYVVLDGNLDLAGTREHLQQELPDYMLPGYMVELEQIPLSANGKLDRKALPGPMLVAAASAELVAPQTEIEAKLVQAWQQILQLDRVGTTDDFFALGGDSIKAIQISAFLQRYGLKLGVSDQFTYRCIRELSQRVTEIKIKAEQGIVSGPVVLVPAQCWFFANGGAARNYWNQAFILSTKAGFDVTALKTTLDKIMEHHDALRMAYQFTGEAVTQFNRGMEGTLLGMEVFDFQAYEDYQELMEKAIGRLQKKIDLEKGPLVNVGLFKIKAGDRLFFSIHHLVVDGVSWRIILEDLEQGYNQVLRGEPVVLQSKTTSFKEWAARLSQYAGSNELLAETEYWRKVIRSGREIISAPPGVCSNKVGDSRQVSVELSGELTDLLLKKASHAYRTEINDLMLAALGLALHQWRHTKRVVISLEGHGREDIIRDLDITRTVGWFTSMYPVVLAIECPGDLSATIKSVKEQIRRIPNKGVGYGILKYLAAGNTPKLQFALQPELGFNYLGQFGSNSATGTFSVAPVPAAASLSPDLERTQSLDIVALVLGGVLQIDLVYNRQRYVESDIKTLAEIYRRQLEMVIRHCTLQETSELTPGDFTYQAVTLKELDTIADLINL